MNRCAWPPDRGGVLPASGPVYVWLLCALLTATLVRPAAAAETPDPAPAPATNTTTIEALVTEALEHNPELAFCRAELAAAKAGRKAAAAVANPELRADAGYKRVTERSGTFLGDGPAWSVSVTQPFEYPGRLALRKAIANRQIELAELGLEQFRATLAARVRNLAYAVMVAQERDQAAREVARRFQDLQSVLVQREPAGVAPLLDLRIIEANVLSANRRSTQATAALQKALFELNQLRGQPLETLLNIERGGLDLPRPPELGMLLAAAATNHFELRLRRVELEQQGFKVELSKNERKPGFTLAPFYSSERGADQEQIVGVGVSVPLPLWNRNTGNIEAAQARHQQAATALLVEQREVEKQVRERALAYQTKLQEMARWRPDSLDRFKEAAELADRHYRLGSVPIANYTEMQKQYLDALDALLDTLAEALESRQQLELLTGLKLETGK